MKVFEGESLEKLYPQIIEGLFEEGDEVSPRGMLTKEITPATIVLTNPRKRVISSLIRKLNYGFMVAELVWMLRGSDSVDEIAHYMSGWKNFSDDGVTLNGAYGKRIFNWDSGLHFDNNNGIHKEHVNQFRQAYEQLKKDKDSRQATIVIFDPNKDYKETKDKPCTNLLRFSIRKNKLNMLVVMRSNDISKGSPYDIFNFTMMQEIMAGLLSDALNEDIEVGTYTHVADSLHMYSSDFEMLENVKNEEYTSIYDKVYDGRLIGLEEFNNTMRIVFKIEEKTRMNKEIELQEVCGMLNTINNEVWKSYAAVLATYNFRKYRRNQKELDTLKQYITNEFRPIFEERYNQLN